MNPTISVIVPVYKAEAYLARCIESVLTQTYTDLELILIDDGSPDNCGAICDAYAVKDTRVRVIHQENQGQAAARNCAVKQAQGEWLCFVDSDDLIHPQMLALLYQAVMDCNARISMCSVMSVEKAPEVFNKCENLYVRSLDISEPVLENLYQDGGHDCWIVCGKLVHKDIVFAIPFADGRIYEDNAVTCRWLYEAGRVADVSESLYFYIQNPESTTMRGFRIQSLDYLWALEEKIKFYDSIFYYVLKHRFCADFLTVSARFYRMVLTQLQRKDVAYDIKKRMKRIWHENKKTLRLTTEQKNSILNNLYPKTMQWYWIGQAGWKEWKRNGVVGFIKKIVKHFCQGGSK